MVTRNLPTRLALASMLLLSLGCKSSRDATRHVSQSETQTQQRSEQIELLTQREALLQGLVITFDSVALTVPIPRKPMSFRGTKEFMGFLSADSVPPHEVNLIARKATIQKSDLRTVTFEGLNARRDTMAKHDEIVEITKENKQKDSGGKPPNGTAIAIFLVFTLLLGVFFTAKK